MKRKIIFMIMTAAILIVGVLAKINFESKAAGKTTNKVTITLQCMSSPINRPDASKVTSDDWNVTDTKSATLATRLGAGLGKAIGKSNTVKASPSYKVTFNVKTGITTKKSGGTTWVYVDTSKVKLSDLVINVTVENEYLYCNRFSTTKNEASKNNGYSYYVNGKGHSLTFDIGSSYIEDDCGVYLSSDGHALCVKEFNEKDTTITFCAYTEKQWGTYESNKFELAANGSSTTKKEGNINATTDIDLSDNYKDLHKKVTTNMVSNVNSKLKSLESWIQIIINFMYGIAFLTSVLAIIMNCVYLAASPSHPIQRRAVLFNFLYSLICLALLSCTVLITKLVFNLIF